MEVLAVLFLPSPPQLIQGEAVEGRVLPEQVQQTAQLIWEVSAGLG